MDLTLDRTLYPRAAAYLDSVAASSSANSEAKINADVFEIMRERFPKLLDGTKIPAIISDAFQGRAGKWVPEVVGNALYLMCRDRAVPNDEAFFAFGYQGTLELFDKALYRVLMRVMSPTLVVMGAQKRWGAFHSGSELTPGKASREGERTYVRATLRYPAKLFPRLMLDYNAHVFRAAVDAAGAKSSAAQVHNYTDSSADIEVSWVA